MAQTVTLANIRADVREYIGMPSSQQISDSDLTIEINDYYREIMPLQLDLPEARGFSEITTADDDESAVLPDDTQMISAPVRIGSGASPSSFTIGGYYTEPVHFFAKHDGSETKGTPLDILLVGRTVFFQPKADGVYKLRFPSVEKPTALVNDSDLIVQDRLRKVISIATSVSVLGKLTDDEAIKSLATVFPLYRDVLSQFGIKIDTQRMSDSRNKAKNVGVANV